MERLLTAHEVAVILRVSKKTIYTWIDSGKIRAHKFEGNLKNHWIRIPESSVKAFLSSTETSSSEIK